MSVAITAQAPVAASSPRPLHRKQPKALARPASRGSSTFSPRPAWTPPTDRRGSRRPIPQLRAGRCSGSCASSSRRRINADATNQATRAKQRAAAAEAKTELATLDTLGSLSKFNSLSQFNPIGQSGSFGQLASLNQFTSVGLPPGPASASLGPRPRPGEQRPPVGHGRQDDQRPHGFRDPSACGRRW